MLNQLYTVLFTNLICLLAATWSRDRNSDILRLKFNDVLVIIGSVTKSVPKLSKLYVKAKKLSKLCFQDEPKFSKMCAQLAFKNVKLLHAYLN